MFRKCDCCQKLYLDKSLSQAPSMPGLELCDKHFNSFGPKWLEVFNRFYPTPSDQKPLFYFLSGCRYWAYEKLGREHISDVPADKYRRLFRIHLWREYKKWKRKQLAIEKRQSLRSKLRTLQQIIASRRIF